MPLVEALLAQYGIEEKRFHWGWISGAEAIKWAQLVRDFTVQVRELGPLDWQRELASKED
jgi:coenzyme F420-reducing hydrogenase delta subunit